MMDHILIIATSFENGKFALPLVMRSLFATHIWDVIFLISNYKPSNLCMLPFYVESNRHGFLC